MVPAAQIIASGLLLTFGIITPESLFASSDNHFPTTILSVAAIVLGTLMTGSFITSRFLSWFINR